jgi:hypothetical protein
VDFDNLFILIIIFSFIARAVGDALKGGKKPPGEQQRPRMPPGQPERQQSQQQPAQQPQQQRQQPQGRLQQTTPRAERPQPQPRMERQPQPRSGADEGSMRERALPRVETRPRPAPDRASDMIPEDLWEILTGQRRAPVPAPPPEPSWEEEEDDDGARLFPRETPPPVVLAPSREDREAADLIRRRSEAVAMRERGLQQYRPKVLSLETEPLSAEARHTAFHAKHEAQAPATVLQRGRQRGIGRFTGVESGGLRRAIILREVLGPPKALE